MADIHDGTQFTLRHGLSSFGSLDTKEPEYEHGQMIDEEDNRSQYFHQKPDDVTKLQGNLFSPQGGHGFWRNLPEDQNQYSQDSGSNSGAGIAKNMNGKGGSQRRSGQVDHIIANQDCTEHLCRIICDFQYLGGTFVSFLCQ